MQTGKSVKCSAGSEYQCDSSLVDSGAGQSCTGQITLFNTSGPTLCLVNWSVIIVGFSTT